MQRETKRQETSSTPYSHKEDQDRTSLSQGTEVEKSNLSNRSQLTRLYERQNSVSCAFTVSLSSSLSVHSLRKSKRSSVVYRFRRMIKNAVYDPLFEGLGLPVDPHLRLFSAS